MPLFADICNLKQKIMEEKAFIFDMNGTMINDMIYHEEAWHKILTEKLGARISRAQTREQMYGKNEELLIRVFGKNKFTLAEMQALSMEKEQIYQANYFPHLKLIKGLGNFFDQAFIKKFPMAIGTAAIPFNVNFVLDNLKLRKYFKAIVTANDVAVSKPNPDVFLKCAELLKIQNENCIVFEDAPKGVEAAKNAGMKAVAITTYHCKEEFAHFENVLFCIDDYNNSNLQGLLI